jgi:hypothetical protein
MRVSVGRSRVASQDGVVLMSISVLSVAADNSRDDWCKNTPKDLAWFAIAPNNRTTTQYPILLAVIFIVNQQQRLALK